MKDIVILTDDRMAEARQARDALTEKGWRVRTVPKEVRLWDEAALSAWAAPVADEIAGVIHPAPEPILGSVEGVSEEDLGFATGVVAKVTIAGDTNRVATIGNKVKNGNDRYFKLDNSEWVYIVPEYSVDKLLPKPPPEEKKEEVKEEPKPAQEEPKKEEETAKKE